MKQENSNLVKQIISDKLSTGADRKKNFGGGKKNCRPFYLF
jgi:hypothetical protein